MPRDLSDLPPELVEGIVCHLELRDLCNLRLTNRATAQGYYKSFFITKTIRLDHDTVTNFSNITEHCRLAVCLRDLNIVGLPTQPGDANSGSDVESVLCNALHNLQRQPEYRGLRSVSVGIDNNTCGSDSKVRFVAGASAVRTTLRALNESGLLVENLDVACEKLSLKIETGLGLFSIKVRLCRSPIVRRKKLARQTLLHAPFRVDIT